MYYLYTISNDQGYSGIDCGNLIAIPISGSNNWTINGTVSPDTTNEYVITYPDTNDPLLFHLVTNFDEVELEISVDSPLVRSQNVYLIVFQPLQRGLLLEGEGRSYVCGSNLANQTIFAIVSSNYDYEENYTLYMQTCKSQYNYG